MQLSLPVASSWTGPLLSGPSAIITVLQVITALTAWKEEQNPESAAPYSKFANKKKDNDKPAQISSRNGMLIIYTPALIVSLISIILTMTLMKSPSYYPSVSSVLCFLHFLKRDLEVLFLHKYSGSTPYSMAITIGVYYALVSLLVISVSPSFDLLSLGEGVLTQNMKIGLILFFTGSTGNFYHHFLLAKLRSTKISSTEEKKYYPPTGGLFEYVAAPHYFFELIAWLGIAFASSHVNALLVFCSMSSYLCGRSVSQNKWNREKFTKEEWPRSRKNILPFIF